MKPVIDRTHPAHMGGVQKIYRFDNGYGASVIRTPYTYGGNVGLWELAVIEFKDEDNENFKLTYETPVTSDVEGYLEWSEVEKLLERIEALDKKEKE
jgi:hypothetical protein